MDLMLQWVREGWDREKAAPWVLPSTGGRGHRCGTHLGTAQACLDCAHRWAVLTSCKAWPCEGCASNKVRVQAMSVAIRVASITDSLALAGLDGVATRRAILSPPQRSMSVFQSCHGHQRMANLRRQAWALAQSKGFLGGAMVFHPMRDRQTWRFQHRGPHFHIIGPATWLGEGDFSDGWVFKASPSRLRLGGAYDRMAYDFTHVGVMATKPVVTYHGAVNPKYLNGALLDERIKARIEGLEAGRVHVCPECSSTNTQAIMPTLEELEAWGIMRPLERRKREALARRMLGNGEAQQCLDCGGRFR